MEGAAANALPRHVPDEVREERRARLMQLQEKISARRLRRRVGQTMRVLVDEVGPEGAVARSAADAPEIDGAVHIEDGAHLQAGEFAQVKVVGSDTHDLWAQCEAQCEARCGARGSEGGAVRKTSRAAPPQSKGIGNQSMTGESNGTA